MKSAFEHRNQRGIDKNSVRLGVSPTAHNEPSKLIALNAESRAPAHSRPARAGSTLPPKIAGALRLSPKTGVALETLKEVLEITPEAFANTDLQHSDELRALQAKATQSLRDSALAMLDLFEALSCAKCEKDLAADLMVQRRRRHDDLNEQLADFYGSMRNLISVLIDPQNYCLLEHSKSAADENAPEEDADIFVRVKSLTSAQLGVLHFMLQGLPNKVIAYHLGITETTVKAHVGCILRKLSVYNRTRAIAMLANIDLAAVAAFGGAMARSKPRAG